MTESVLYSKFIVSIKFRIELFIVQLPCARLGSSFSAWIRFQSFFNRFKPRYRQEPNNWIISLAVFGEVNSFLLELEPANVGALRTSGEALSLTPPVGISSHPVVAVDPVVLREEEDRWAALSDRDKFKEDNDGESPSASQLREYLRVTRKPTGSTPPPLVKTKRRLTLGEKRSRGLN